MATFDAIVAGATFSACVAAISLARKGHSVALVAAENSLGGMITGGLGISDAPATRTWWGVSRDFIDQVAARTGYTNERLKWCFAPDDAQTVLDAMVAAEPNITVRLGETITKVKRSQAIYEPGSLETTLEDIGELIQCIETDRAGDNVYEAPVMIDGTYGGMLIRAADVPFRLGRDNRDVVTDARAGFNLSHASERAVDMVTLTGDLSKYAQYDPQVKDGMPDVGSMALGWRLCVTNDPAKMQSPRWPAPPGYNPADFAEDIARAQEKAATLGLRDVTFGMILRRTNYNEADAQILNPDFAVQSQTERETAHLSATTIQNLIDVPGVFATNGSDITGAPAWEYSIANEARRKEIREQLAYRELGRLHTWATHPDVPQAVRDRFNEVGLCNDQWQTDFTLVPGWPPELYQRVGIFLQGADRVNFNDVAYKINQTDQIAVGGYFVDSKAVNQIAKPFGGSLREGDYGEGHFTSSDGDHVGIEDFSYFGIPMGAVIPPPDVADNLAVTWCISTTAMSWGAVRLEPLLATVADAVAVMADEALQTGQPIARLNYERVKARLDAAGWVANRYGVPL